MPLVLKFPTLAWLEHQFWVLKGEKMIGTLLAWRFSARLSIF